MREDLGRTEEIGTRELKGEGSPYWRQLPPEWQGRHEEDYRKGVLDPSSWIAAGDNMTRAAELLRPAVEASWEATRRRFSGEESRAPLYAPFEAYYMLLGFAAENYLKGALVRRDRDRIGKSLVGASTLAVTGLKTHGLEDLVKRLQVKIDEGERPILAALETRIVWSGRYPVPSQAQDADLATGVHADFWVNKAPELVARFRLIADGGGGRRPIEA